MESLEITPDQKTSRKRIALLVLLFCLPGLFLVFAVRGFLFQPFNIPSESNHPNLVIGDHFLVSKFAYGYSRYSFPFGLSNFKGRIWEAMPQRGDVVVYRKPSNTKVDFVFRIVGLPGDRIQMISGIPHINGEPVEQVPETLDAVYFKTGSPPIHGFFRETLPGGRSYVIADMGDTEQDNSPEFLVPAGQFFMLGDNRDNSMDSRFEEHGFVPFENLIGKVVLRYFNVNGVPVSNRPAETP